MPTAHSLIYFLKDPFPAASPELMRLLEAAAEHAGLLRSDYTTIRDWLEVADYAGAEGLTALLLVLMLSLEEGSLCVEASDAGIARRLVDLVGAEDAQRWAHRIVGDLAADSFPRLIGQSANDNRPVIVHAVGGQRYIYFQKYLKAELAFHAQFVRRLQAALPPAPDNLAAVMREVFADQPLLVGAKPLILDDDQQRAVRTALLRNLAIISGGPGTGKTSIVLTILRCLVRCGFKPERIALAAPTGRAAQRLSDALRAGLEQLPRSKDTVSLDRSLHDIGATTLHQLLAYRPSRNLFTRHAENPIPADVVIVDEASMVGLVLMAQLLEALEPAAKLVLLGDKDQLPSVDAGAVLANLIPEPGTRASPLSDSVVLLQTNHRSQQQIRETADAINRQEIEVIDRLEPVTFDAAPAVDWQRLSSRGGCCSLEQTHATPAEIRGFLRSVAEYAYFGGTTGQSLGDMVAATELTETADGVGPTDELRRLFALLERFRVLTLVREGPWGAVDINRFLADLLRPRLDPGTPGSLFAGAPVLITRNDAARQLNNGDVGIVLRRTGGGLRVVFPRQAGFVAWSPESLPAHELGFALTVHKSQGSEYGHVLVVLPPEGGRRLLTKELLYTAITRAKSLAVLCGTREALRFAISRRIVREAGVLRSLTSVTT